MKGKSRSTTRCNKFVAFLLCVILILLIITAFLFSKSIYPGKIVSALGIREYVPKDFTLLSWNRCIEQLIYDADIVFFGDSLTSRINFQKAFPEYKIVNLGLSGDNLTQMKNRADIIANLHPEKIFIMGGVNSLDDLSINKASSIYAEILDIITETNPNAKVYIQSILPISKSAYSRKLTNDNIRLMNASLQAIADEHKMEYLDLYSIYDLDGYLNSEYTEDGIHLNGSSEYLWIEAIRPYVNE